ncbi:uncharacterized protein MONBRDRAFT_33525 [Monosiga brevicollis MX1]|uniref:Cupin type-2 domain-containing protein n=1 Tax=Monosiga brevicollis TaxID=81824 RepID=A9V5W3_MONBE|nr:uncharacterized protein MONBRDRAFT_33525 [Monosiga brevicollis MX1]EDQ87115.1 predicted protein [Monosiga brevicollis MX1]|eukprot:XP_001748058.1 hypothetical protein [Monosiga brevicollis MX1]
MEGLPKPPTSDEDMRVIRDGSMPAMPGPAKFFTGEVRIAKYLPAPEPSRLGVAVVQFEPGARTNWHTHPLGQILVVTKGTGWTQCEGGQKTEIRPGDMIWCNCNRRHWHGATDTTSLEHVAINESLDGKPVEWQEAVSDEIYLSADIKKD